MTFRAARPFEKYVEPLVPARAAIDSTVSAFPAGIPIGDGGRRFVWVRVKPSFPPAVFSSRTQGARLPIDW